MHALAMALVRTALGALVVASSLAFALPADAGQLDACAQRVIRDWYAGGKVDRAAALTARHRRRTTGPDR